MILAACGATAACTPPPAPPAPLAAQLWTPAPPPPPPAAVKTATPARAPLHRLPVGLAEAIVMPERTAARLDQSLYAPERPPAAARSLGLTQLASEHRDAGREDAALRAAGAAHVLAVQAFGAEHAQTRATFRLVVDLSRDLREGRGRMRRLAASARSHAS